MTLIFSLLLACSVGPSRPVHTEDLAVKPGQASTIHLQQGVGDLEVVPTSDGQIHLEVTLLGPANDGGDSRMVENMEVWLELAADGAVEANSTMNGVHANYGLHTRLGVPQGVHVVIDDGSGDVDIEHIHSLDISDGSGDLSIADVPEGVWVNDGSGDIDIVNTGGELVVDDGSGDIDVQHHNGDATIRDGSGDIELTDVDGRATITDGSGDIDTHRVGSLKILADGSGDVD